MRLLLTSAGIKNTSIRDALVDLLRKPIAESSALCVPSASYGDPEGDPARHGGSSPDEPPPPCANWAGSPRECSNSPRCPASTKSSGGGTERREHGDDPSVVFLIGVESLRVGTGSQAGADRQS